VPHDRDAGRDDALDRRRQRAAALELDRVHGGFLQVAARVPHGVGHVGLVGHEGKVADEQGALRAARDRAGVMQHLVHRHRERGGMAEHDHGQ
jgi:hypothetical protein